FDGVLYFQKTLDTFLQPDVVKYRFVIHSCLKKSDQRRIVWNIIQYHTTSYPQKLNPYWYKLNKTTLYLLPLRDVWCKTGYVYVNELFSHLQLQSYQNRGQSFHYNLSKKSIFVLLHLLMVH